MAEAPLAAEKIIGLLHDCRQQKSLPLAKRLLAYIRRHRLETDTAIGNHLVPVLVECGSLLDARAVFEKLRHRNEFSWSSLISGYIDSPDPRHAFLLYHSMQEESVLPNTYTFVSLLKACIAVKDLAQGHSIHSDAVALGLDSDLFIGNTLVDMYGKCNSLAEGQSVLDKMLVRDQVSWTALISGYADNSLSKEALDCYKQMHLDCVSPNASTFVCTIKACTRLKDAQRGQELHAEMIALALESGLFVGSTLVDMYGKCGLLAEAYQVFNNITEQDEVLWTALISGYAEHGFGERALSCFQQMQQKGIPPNASTFVCSLKACESIRAIGKGQELYVEIAKKGLEVNVFIGSAIVSVYAKHGLLEEAQDVFDQLPRRNAVTWTALIAGYAEYQHGEEALLSFKKMELDRVSPDAFIYACSLKACCLLGTLEAGQEIHSGVIKRGLENDLSVTNILLDTYTKCGLLADGQNVFDNMPVKDVVSWTAMLKGYGDNHKGDLVVQCFENMQEEGVKPNAVTFTCLLDACSHASLVMKGQEYFKMMRELNIQPSLDHYGCMVDLFARSGQLQEAEKFVESMQSLESKEDVLTALLTACRIHGEVELSLRCFQQLVQESREDAASYSMLAEVYASDGRWIDATQIEELRNHARAAKRPARASIEVNTKLHEFVVGDNLSNYTFVMLEVFSFHLKDEGYVPDLDLIMFPEKAEFLSYQSKVFLMLSGTKEISHYQSP